MSRYSLPALLIIGLLSVTWASKDWSYHNFGDWGGVCATGKSQSPIDIDEESAEEESVEPLLFLHYDDTINGFSMTNNGHTITLQLRHPCKIAVAGGGLRGFYILDHVHFHWGSEHTVEHTRYPAEVHLVHFNKIYGNISEAKNHPRGLAVIGIFLEEGDEDNEALEPVLLESRNAIEDENIRVPVTEYSLEPLVPDDTDEFYRYDGSLTTPPCSETVVWTLMKETVSISKRQVEQLHQIHLSHGATNYRPVQPLNDRQVKLLSSELEPASRTGSASLSQLTKSLFFIAAIGFIFN